MKEVFIDKTFDGDAALMLEHSMAILDRYSSEGFDLTLRQLYYQLVAADLIPHDRSYKNLNGKWVRCPIDQGGSTNAEPNYKWIGDIISAARMAGLVDWDMIADRGRISRANPHWENPRDFMDSVAPQFSIDKWADQPSYVEVMVEKDALSGILQPVCAQLDIRFCANKGYSSSSALYEAGKRIENKLSDGKHCHVIYLGDHDPSGIDMTRDIEDRLNVFAHVNDHDAQFHVHRVALNLPQVRKLNPPENPAKLTDSRANGYISQFGNSSWELDAIEPKALAQLVRDKVRSIRDGSKWDAAVERETSMRNELIALAKRSKFK